MTPIAIGVIPLSLCGPRKSGPRFGSVRLSTWSDPPAEGARKMPLRLAMAAWRRAEHDTAIDRDYLPCHVDRTLRAQPCDGSSDILGRLLASERNQVSHCTLERKPRATLAAANRGAEVLPYFRIDEPRRDRIDPDSRGTKLERERLGIGNNTCLGGSVRRQKWCREHPGNRRRVADGAAACHPGHDLLAHEIDGIKIQLDVTAPNIDAMPLLV